MVLPFTGNESHNGSSPAKAILFTLLGVITGAFVGTIIGMVVGLFIASLNDVPCVYGGCFYMAILYYAPVGLLFGAIGGGILFYMLHGSTSKVGVWLFTLAGAFLGGLVISRVILIVFDMAVMWFLMSGVEFLPDANNINVITMSYYGFRYVIMLICSMVLSGLLVYKFASSPRQPAGSLPLQLYRTKILRSSKKRG